MSKLVIPVKSIFDSIPVILTIKVRITCARPIMPPPYKLKGTIKRLQLSANIPDQIIIEI